MTKKDKQRALSLISKSLKNANDDTIKRVLCAVMGHPPVVKSCFG